MDLRLGGRGNAEKGGPIMMSSYSVNRDKTF